ncbi:hypothetical protein D9619_004492 [Psilocybe cf. subviscida]|uniref:Ubiquinone biosynthesis protein n=1 Tax=Psilocybe cf. subviscida TaxID=2480587 RepID=A0A8H5BNQ1_9AGAR|nr:hypothetical protein D9619_004492 [Psilocybe cf. subviscida]
MPPTSAQLLKLALPLVKTHGFTREALARSVLSLPPSERSYTEPLSDSAVTALFGKGDQAKRTLIDAWMQDGLRHMAGSAVATGNAPSLKDAFRARLKYNEDVLSHLPAAYALLATNSNFHIVDPMPALRHASTVADNACAIVQDRSLQLDWYAKRASLAAIYATAELHQLTSPHTAYSFLDSLFDTSASVKASVDEVSLYSTYIMKSWTGIIKSSGVLL